MAAARLDIVSSIIIFVTQFHSNNFSLNSSYASLCFQQPNFRAKKSLNLLEKEIVGIGADQKVIFNRLRLFIDYFLLRNKVDRKQLTDFVSEEISNYAKTCAKDIRPIRVKHRLCAADLHAKFFAEIGMKNLPREPLSTSQKDGNRMISLDEANCADDDDMKGEVMEFLMSPEDIPGTNVPIESSSRSYQQKRQLKTEQESLLKPKEERISLPKDDGPRTSTSPPSHEAINLSRLKLREALCKAKGKKDEPNQFRIKAKSASPEPVRCASVEPKPIATLSSSQSSSSSSSEDIYEAVAEDVGDSTAVDKDTFMRLFGLCTHSYSHYLSRRHTKRKRRNVSTERGDFHYGRLDLFEKQYANKRNKRQFLYSPPATRAKKQRRAASDAEAHSVAITNAPVNAVPARGPKTQVFSLSSALPGPISTKVCVTCFKRSKLPAPMAKCPSPIATVRSIHFYYSTLSLQTIYSNANYARGNTMPPVTQDRPMSHAGTTSVHTAGDRRIGNISNSKSNGRINGCIR